MIKPKEIELLIKKYYPNAIVKILDYGFNREEGVNRYSIITNLFNSEIKFNLAQNLIFSIDNVPRHMLKMVSFSNDPNEAKAMVELCIKELKIYLTETEIPKVKTFARKYLGIEKKVEVKKNATYIYYDLFHLSVNPSSIFLVLSSSNRAIRFWDLKKNYDFEKIFKAIKIDVDGINQGLIRH